MISYSWAPKIYSNISSTLDFFYLFLICSIRSSLMGLMRILASLRLPLLLFSFLMAFLRSLAHFWIFKISSTSASISFRARHFSLFLMAAIVYPTELSHFLFRGFLGAVVDAARVFSLGLRTGWECRWFLVVVVRRILARLLAARTRESVVNRITTGEGSLS